MKKKKKNVPVKGQRVTVIRFEVKRSKKKKKKKMNKKR